MKITLQDALVVVDVQNDFCTGGALAVPEGEVVIPVIHRIAPHFAHIILTQDWHPPGHCSFASSRSPSQSAEIPGASKPGKPDLSTNPGGLRAPHAVLWPDHCVQGTPGADFHPALALTRAELILRKGFRRDLDSYSAFFENDRTTPTGLAGYCRERGFRRIFFAGLAYDFCVGFSAVDARSCGFDAFVLTDACRAIKTNGSVQTMDREFSQHGIAKITSTALEPRG